MPHQPLLPELLHFLHHAGHVLMLLQEAVDIRHRGARSRRNPPAARAVQQLRVFALGFGHRSDDRLLALDDGLVDIRRVELLLDLADPGKHAEHAAHPAHAAQLPQLRGEIVEIEIALLEFLGEPLGLVAVGGLGGALDQGDDVAHSENAAGDALGMKRLERVNLFAGADHDNRLAGDRPHRQRGAAGRCTSSEAISTFLRSRFFRRSAIFAAVVVLPEPCSPTSMIPTGDAALRSRPPSVPMAPREGSAPPPSISTRWSCTILTTICPGVTERSTSCPSARSRTALTKSRTTGSATSASKRARAISRNAAATSSSLSAPRPRRRSKTSLSRLLKLSNIERLLRSTDGPARETRGPAASPRNGDGEVV